MKIQQLTSGILSSRISPPSISRTFNIKRVTYYYVMCEVVITHDLFQWEGHLVEIRHPRHTGSFQFNLTRIYK